MHKKGYLIHPIAHQSEVTYPATLVTVSRGCDYNLSKKDFLQQQRNFSRDQNHRKKHQRLTTAELGILVNRDQTGQRDEII